MTIRTRATIRSTKTFQNPKHMKTKIQSILSAAVAKVSVLLLVTVSLFLSSPVKGQCPKGWSVPHNLDFMQVNQVQRNELRLYVQGDRFNGFAMYMTANRSSEVEGKVAGSVSGDKIHFEISWSNGLTGVYDATISLEGRSQAARVTKSVARQRRYAGPPRD